MCMDLYYVMYGYVTQREREREGDIRTHTRKTICSTMKLFKNLFWQVIGKDTF